MSSSKAPSSVKVGDYVKLTLLDDRSVSYSGKVIAVSNFSVARSLGSDIVARHEQIKSSITTVSGDSIDDVTDQMFLVIQTDDTMPLVVAYQWIAGNSVEVIELGSTYNIKLLNASKELAEEAVSVLRSNGISCKLNVVY